MELPLLVGRWPAQKEKKQLAKGFNRTESDWKTAYSKHKGVRFLAHILRSEVVRILEVLLQQQIQKGESRFGAGEKVLKLFFVTNLFVLFRIVRSVDPLVAPTGVRQPEIATVRLARALVILAELFEIIEPNFLSLLNHVH